MNKYLILQVTLYLILQMTFDLVLHSADEEAVEQTVRDVKIEDVENDVAHKPELNGVHDEKYADMDDADWSDFDDAKIEDEIEAELRGMDSEMPAGSKVQTSPSPYRSRTPPSPPHVKVDWSDIPESASDKAPRSWSGGGSKALQLGGKSVKKEVESPTSPDDNEWGDDNWGETTDAEVPLKSVSDSAISQASKTSKSLKLNSSKAKAKTERKPPTSDLGAGYDIKSINIVSKTEAALDDFFADMTPQVKSATSLSDFLPGLTDQLTGGEGSGVESEDVGSKSQMFAVTEDKGGQVSHTQGHTLGQVVI